MILTTLLCAFLLIAAQGIYRNWNRATFDALPPHLDEAHEWDGKDHDKVWYTRWVKYVKGWFAMSPLSHYSWARWRETPVLLFAMFGKGFVRFEDDEQTLAVSTSVAKYAFFSGYRAGDAAWYLSRCQYWTRWHFAVQWPLQITFHVYWRAKDVPEFLSQTVDMSLKKMLFVYGPTHRDADKVYWVGSFFVGGSWK